MGEQPVRPDHMCGTELWCRPARQAGIGDWGPGAKQEGCGAGHVQARQRWQAPAPAPTTTRAKQSAPDARSLPSSRLPAHLHVVQVGQEPGGLGKQEVAGQHRHTCAKHAVHRLLACKRGESDQQAGWQIGHEGLLTPSKDGCSVSVVGCEARGGLALSRRGPRAGARWGAHPASPPLCRL